MQVNLLAQLVLLGSTPLAVDTQHAWHVGLAEHQRSSSRPSKLWRSRELHHGYTKWVQAATGCCRSAYTADGCVQFSM
eukprot:760919-Amphidinium_carterae.1